MAEPAFRIELRGARRLIEKVNDPRLIAEPVRTFFHQASVAVAGEVRERTPVNTGRLRNSITNEVDRRRVPLFAKVGTNVSYARFVEEGSRPHWPPLSALQPWARRHGFPAGRAGAFLVARAISRRGTKPHKMFEKGLANSLGRVRKLLNNMGRDIARNWRLQ